MRAALWMLPCGVIGLGCTSEGGLSQKVDPDATADEVTTTDEAGGGGDVDGDPGPGQDTASVPADVDVDVDADSDADADADVDSDTDSDVTAPDTGLTGDEICVAAAQSGLATYLDPWQTPNDNHVYYCHSGSGSNYNFVDSNISSCLPHLNHVGDIFPSTGCDS